MKDIYMATREDKVLTRITVEHYDKRYIVESPYSDGDVIGDLLDLLYRILLMVTYTEDTINRALVEFAEEHGAKVKMAEDEV